LNDPAAVNRYVEKEGGEAKAADALVNRLTTNPGVRQEIYGLSSEVFQELVRKTNGDPTLMMQEIEKAKKDPEGFARSWSPEAQAKLRSLSGKVEAPPANPR